VSPCLPPEGFLALGEGSHHFLDICKDEQQVSLPRLVGCADTILDQEVVIVLPLEVVLLDDGQPLELHHQALGDVV
jgi:hypothetical protein